MAKREQDPKLAALIEQKSAELEIEVKKGTCSSVIEIFKGMEYPVRRKLHPTARKLRSEARKASLTNWNNWTIENRAALALFATGTASEVTKRKEFRELLNFFGGSTAANDRPSEAVYTFVREHRPEWIPRFVDFVLDQPDTWNTGAWNFALAMTKEGFCDPPTHPGFATQLFQAIAPDHQKKITPWQRFEADWKILAPQMERSFGLPEADSISNWQLGTNINARSEHFTRDFPGREHELDWHWIIPQAVEKQYLDRQRILEACLEGLTITRNRSRAKWLTVLFDRLLDHEEAPSLASFAGPDGELIPLLNSPIAGTVTWVLRKLNALQKSGELDLDAFFDYLPVPLTATAKGTVLTTIRLTKRAVKKTPRYQSLACETVTDALLHENPDVHREVLKFLDELGDPSDEVLQEKIGEFASGLSPSVRELFRPWMGDLGEIVLAEAEDDDPPSEIKPVSVLSGDRSIPPIRSIDDFIARLSFFFQKPEETEIGELGVLFGGFGKFIEDQPDDLADRCGALRKLARGESGDWSLGFSIMTSPLSQLIRFWIGERKPVLDLGKGNPGTRFLKGLFSRNNQPPAEVSPEPSSSISTPRYHLPKAHQWAPTPPRILQLYYSSVCHYLRQKQNFSLLSEPTHEQGWIDPIVLGQRIASWPRDLSIAEMDLCVALLRLAPENRTIAPKDAPGLSGVAGAAFRYAIGDDSALPEISEQPAILHAAARSRTIHGSCPEISSNQPDGRDSAEFLMVPRAAHQVPSRWNKTVMIDVPAKLNWKCRPALTDSDAPLPAGIHFACRSSRNQHFPNDSAYVRWIASLWPANHDAVLANATRHFCDHQDSSASNWIVQTQVSLIELLANNPQPLTRIGITVLALGVTAGQAAVRASAEDTLIEAIGIRRIDPADFGKIMADLIEFDYPKANRYLPVFQTVSRLSNQHSKFITRTLCHALEVERDSLPHRFGQVIEFLAEQQFAHPDEIQFGEKATRFLESLSPKSKAGKAAKTLLQK